MKKQFFCFLSSCFATFGILTPLYGPADEFPFQEGQNISLMPGLGSLHHPVTTHNPEAQRFFDQGFTFIYAFNHDAAFWSFRKAAELDPNMAMAYWGMALAVGPNINMNITPERQQIAYYNIQKALSLSSHVTNNERAYIEALATRYTDQPNPDLQKLALQYKNAMEKVIQHFPDDLDAAALYAESALDLDPWNQWAPNGEPREGTLAVVALLESILKRDPFHLGANHYYIHAIEASRHPERALMSAERLRTMVPASGHILHMPSHIYILVGDYHTAALVNEQAVAVDRAYIRKFGMQGIYPLHYMSHNLYFLSRAYSMEGRFEEAMRAGNELKNFYVPHFKKMPELEYYAPASMLVLLRFSKWKELLQVPSPPVEMQITKTLWHFARAMAFASLGEIEKAKHEQQFFIRDAKALPTDAVYGYNKAADIMHLANTVLNAKIAEQQGSAAQAADLLAQAAAFQDELHYNEPPDWFYPVRESLGGVLLRSKRYHEAEQVFRQDLDKHPRNGRALFGLLISLKAQGRQDDSFWIERELKKAWKYSTTPLSVSTL